MPYTVVTHVGANTGGSGDFTTGTMLTAGADLIVGAQSWFTPPSGSTLNPPTDNKSNVYTTLTPRDGTRASVRLFYKQAPTVGTGHTFTQTDVDGGGGDGSMIVGAFAGSVATPLDQQSGFAQTTTGHTTIQAPSITPGGSAYLYVVAVSLDDPANSTWLFDSGFTVLGVEDVVSGQSFGLVLGYKIKTDATAESPIFTRSNANTSGSDAIAMATFKVSSGGVIVLPRPAIHLVRRLGVGAESVAMPPARHMILVRPVRTSLKATGALPLSLGMAATAVALVKAMGTLALALGMSGAAMAPAQATGTLALSLGVSATGAVRAQAAGSLPLSLGMSGAAVTQAVVTRSGIHIVKRSHHRATAAALAKSRAASRHVILLAAATPLGSGANATGTLPLSLGLSGVCVARPHASGTLPLALGVSGTGQARVQASVALPLGVGVAATCDARAKATGSLPLALGMSGIGEIVTPGTSRASGVLPLAIDLAAMGATRAKAGGALPLALSLAGTAIARSHITAYVDEPLFIDFDLFAGRLLFLSPGGTEMLILTMIRGEIDDMVMHLRGAGNAPQDLTGVTSLELTVWDDRVAEFEPIIDGQSLEVVDAMSGTAKYRPRPSEVAIAGKFEAEVVVVYPDTTKRKFPGLIVIKPSPTS